MVKAVKGTIVKCDPAVKQVILSLDKKEKVIIEDLDDNHLLIDTSRVDYIKKEVEKLLEENTYKSELDKAPN
ncbi:40913_t:CDS:2 [Gigaspora margarita]|uniref:40913_t:CDS:1 n=2 Tax=Gigaspora margarita TaxID=4874 RepID=A0ABN7UFZ9_GIGMA|nr:nucleotide excision repair, TFIIH, subunit [Gigaspora margarita]CAG8587504.1 40913_t:CDS:2 [Gigaspora margarita]